MFSVIVNVITKVLLIATVI